MKAKELRELTLEELQHKHEDLWSELFGLRVKHALGQLENPLQLRAVRRDIARTKTLLTAQGVREASRPRRQAPPGRAKAAAVGGKARGLARTKPAPGDSEAERKGER